MAGKSVHPAFVSMVGQMDDMDMLLLRNIREQQAMPIADCYLSRMKKGLGLAGKMVEDTASAIPIVLHMTAFLSTDGDYERVQAAMDNLLRLRLIDIRMREERRALEEIQDDAYEDIYMLFEPAVAQAVQQLCSSRPEYREWSIRMQEGNIVLTALGSRFLQVCSV